MNLSSSKALEVNIKAYRVEVKIDPKYKIIQEVMSKYKGLSKNLNAFLEEVCHPRRNYKYIVKETRTFSHGYFFDLKTHPKGPEAARLYIDILLEAIENPKDHEVKSDAFSVLYLFVQKLINDTGDELLRFIHVINHAFTGIYRLNKDDFFIVIKSYYQIKRLAALYLQNVPLEAEFRPVNLLLKRYLEYTYEYWLGEKDPLEWFESEVEEEIPQSIRVLFDPILHRNIELHRTKLEEIVTRGDLNSQSVLKALIELPGYGDFVRVYKELPDKIKNLSQNEHISHAYRLIFLSHSMNISGLSSIHEDTLRQINRDISWLIEHEDIERVKCLLERTFRILKKNFNLYPDAVLKCVLNMGKGVYKTDESELVRFFNEQVVKLGFQTPDFSGLSEDWQIISNKAHIQNIRTWMEIIELNPKWSKKLLSSLIINLSLCGVLIKDTDLFPRDITRFLNSDIRPVYNLTKQLMRLFPAYFNEIGAEGRLRDVSTKIDEVYNRKDRLIHFLRKQSHVESSNKIISFMEAILEFWRTKSKEPLRTFIPQGLYEWVQPEGKYIDNVHTVLSRICEKRDIKKIPNLLHLDQTYLEQLEDEFPEIEQVDIERVRLAIQLYKLLYQKYHVSFCDIDEYIEQIRPSLPLNLEELKETLTIKDTFRKISRLLDFLEKLKEIILSPEKFEIREDIYRKRHIAADIPSMYGSYREVKFDALGLTFRIESMVNVLFEELVESINLNFITHETLSRIYRYLTLFNRALEIDGIPTREFQNQLDILKRALRVKLFSFTQYIDIFRGFNQIIRHIVNDHFESIHSENIREIIKITQRDRLLPKYSKGVESDEELCYRASEIFLRDIIASSLGLQRLDLFLSRISNTLHEQASMLPPDKHYLMLTYNPRNIITSIDSPDTRVFDIVHLGNKAFNIIKMKQLGLPVPPGFIITTEVFRCRELIEKYSPANQDFRKRIEREIANLEKITGRKYGSPNNTLLLSVRSGSAISQPGMMDSYLDVGMNPEIVEGMIRQTGKGWFVWDCYRRFIQSYGMSHGLSRDEFDAIINDFKNKFGVSFKRDFTPDQMREVALAYREYVESKGIVIEDSPMEQLYIAISRVLNSWNSEKAEVYRKIMGISDDWGTAVTVQVMVFGNLSDESGSGVLFTHSPKFLTDKLNLWGDYTIGNQGEDVVAGLVMTYPISLAQAQIENRPEEYSLQMRFPEIYNTLREYAKKMIYENRWAPQDIEFTFEGPSANDLYLLQTRNMEMRGRQKVSSFESTEEISEKFLAHGIGVSGGALSGRVVFSMDEINYWREKEPSTSLILIRNDTVPDDIKEISASDGLLTARGGATSHAAIIANRLGKTCVVGCKDLICLEQERRLILNGKSIKSGEFISIDGNEGSVYYGKMKIITGGE